MRKNLFHILDEDDFYKSDYLIDLDSKILPTNRLHEIYDEPFDYIIFHSDIEKRYEHSLGVMQLYNYKLRNFEPYRNVTSNSENIDVEKAAIKIVNEIFNIDRPKDIGKKENAIIVLSPVNDKVLKYLSENSQAFYQLGDRDFEAVMAKIYNKLGYKVELTKTTHDGGKDIILRKPEILGDFIYYVECKKYSPEKPIGVGIIRNLVGTINTDRVNGGILATTSYFTSDAKKFIIDNKYDYQIKMHDYDVIRKLLDQVV